MYTSCLNYGYRAKGHRANGFTTDGGFAQYAVNNINTMVHVPDDMSDEEARQFQEEIDTELARQAPRRRRRAA